MSRKELNYDEGYAWYDDRDEQFVIHLTQSDFYHLLVHKYPDDDTLDKEAWEDAAALLCDFSFMWKAYAKRYADRK